MHVFAGRIANLAWSLWGFVKFGQLCLLGRELDRKIQASVLLKKAPMVNTTLCPRQWLLLWMAPF